MEKEFAEIILSPINEIVEKSNLQIILEDKITLKKVVHNFDFVETRVRAGQVSIGKNIDTTLANLVKTIEIDHPILFKPQLILGPKIKIDVINTDLIVADLIAYNPVLGQPIFQPEILNPPIRFNFEISSVNFTRYDVASCSQVKVRITTNQAMTSYCKDFLCNPINNSFIEFIADRGSDIVFKAVRNSQSVTQNISVPSLLNTPIVNVISTPFGATVSALIPNAVGLELQYSLDSVNWQTSNVFSGLDIGNYVLYVKDQLGCSKNKTFSVLENSFGYKPYVFISKENSFRFKEPNGVYLTDENQFFNQSYNTINYCFIQDFLNTDIITTQFKSNYQNVSAFVTDLDSGLETQIPVVKRTNNLGIKQKYSNVKKYKINNTQFGVYFESGNILDYDTNLPIEGYSLNGSLPIWAKLGNYIALDGAFYQINSIGFDENVNAEVLIFNGIMNQQQEIVVASSIYNLQEYEIYEFEVRFINFQNKRLQLDIRNSDPNYGNYRWVSEEIHTNQALNRYLEIRYYNSTNTNVVYSTGIEHLLRIPFNKIKAVDSDSSENYTTDTNSHLLDSKIYEITEFDFMPLPLELWRKLKIALSVDSIFIDGVGYSKNSEFTKEALGSSNLYKLTAQMIKNGFVFNSSMQTNEFIIEEPVLNIPGLIENNSNGFIQY